MASVNEREDLVKVVLPLPDDAWHGQATETLWAVQSGEGVYRLRNVPFYATDLSFDDAVSARSSGDRLVFQDVVARGGHSTYRTFLSDGVEPESTRFAAAWQPLQLEGCSYERATARLFAVDVAPHADIHKVYALLEEGVRQGVWDFEEGHCGHPL